MDEILQMVINKDPNEVVEHVVANFYHRSTVFMKMHYSCFAIREECQNHSSEIKEKSLERRYFIFGS